MTNLQYVKAEPISLKSHPDFNEQWLKDAIVNDPSLLGLGADLIVKDIERIQPKGGRLDLLLQDANSNQRYEVEIQLGKTDESHIIRTIEYWDIERKRYPQYDHTAVIIAEDITSRFLNVISLFNGFIPLIAKQINAIKLGNHLSLVCTTVLDQMTLGLEEPEIVEVVDRSYWEKRGTKTTVAMADQLFELIKTIDPALELKYNKFYIGLAKEGQANNFATFCPLKNGLRLEVRLRKSTEVDEKIDEAGLTLINYTKWGTYAFKIFRENVKSHVDLITDLFQKAYTEFGT